MSKVGRAGLLGGSALVMLIGAGVAGSASAQTVSAPDTASQVSEVVITATRREATNTLKTALAVDAYAGTALQKLDIYSESDLSMLDPALDIQAYGPAEERIIIRGISSDVGATTGVYLDETPLEGGFNDDIPGDNTPTLGLYDDNHVEVLKGPQGTLFGAGSMDGTVRIVTNAPNLDSYSGHIEGSAGSVDGGEGQFQSNASVNIPLIKDTLGLRVVAWSDNGGGYINQTIDGITRDDVNGVQLYGFRAELLWKPTDRLSITASANYQSTFVGGVQYWSQYVGGLEYPYSPFIGPSAPYTNQLPSQMPYWQQFQLYSVTARYDTGFGSIIANTAYGYKNEQLANDTSAQDCNYDLCIGFGYPPAIYTAHSDFWYTSNDVRFASDFKGPFQIVAGVYYEHDHQVYNGTVVNASPTDGVPGCWTWNQCLTAGLVQPGLVMPYEGVNAVQFANESRQTTDEVAVYAQGDYKILPNLTATVGIRYFTANIEYALIQQQNIAPSTTPYGFDCGYIFGCVTRPYLAAKLGGPESQPTYNAALLWEATPNLSFYARAASGFRLGGLNEAATIASQTGISIPSSYGPDSLWDYEAGVKAYFLDKRLFVDLTGFHVDWSNEQEVGVAYGIYGYTLNVGKSSINGLELNTAFRPVPDLTLTGGFTYVDATLASNLPGNVFAGGTPGVIGDPMPLVPHWTATAQAEYDHHLTDEVIGYLQGNFTYHGTSYSAFEASPTGVSPVCGCVVPDDYDTQLPAFLLVDLKAGVRVGRYDVSVFAKNVTNIVAWTGVSTSDSGVSVYTAPPRTVGLKVSADF